MTSAVPPLALTATPDGFRFDVRVTPRAGRTGIAGVRDGRLAVRVAAAPVDGEANAALTRAIADALRIAHGRVRIVRGERGRLKTIEVRGVDVAEGARRLAGDPT